MPPGGDAVHAGGFLDADGCVGFEDTINTFVGRAANNISELLLDHDYTVPAMEKYAEGSLSYWGGMIAMAKKMEKTVLEPLIAFRKGDLRTYKVRGELHAAGMYGS